MLETTTEVSPDNWTDFLLPEVPSVSIDPTQVSLAQLADDLSRRLSPVPTTTTFSRNIPETTEESKASTIDITTTTAVGTNRSADQPVVLPANIHHRQARIDDASADNASDAKQSPTGWHIRLLPSERNSEKENLFPESGSPTPNPEGWTPFTIPHDSLDRFLFSTLITEPPPVKAVTLLDDTTSSNLVLTEAATGRFLQRIFLVPAK